MNRTSKYVFKSGSKIVCCIEVAFRDPLNTTFPLQLSRSKLRTHPPLKEIVIGIQFASILCISNFLRLAVVKSTGSLYFLNDFFTTFPKRSICINCEIFMRLVNRKDEKTAAFL